MSSYATNGYLVDILEKAKDTLKHPEHREADQLLSKFRNMESTFFSQLHTDVDIGLAMIEVEDSSSSTGAANIFTKHGCQHIADLISKLDELTKSVMESRSKDEMLNVQEAYILLCAAHIHDAGNIAGREGHTERCSAIIEQHPNFFPDTAITTGIYQVASAHGGQHPEYGKDTIRGIDANYHDRPRLPMLAALLRIGDELSDNPARVPSALLEYFEPSMLSQLAHAYAKSFAQSSLRKHTLFITYNVYKEQHEMSFNGEVHFNQGGIIWSSPGVFKKKGALENISNFYDYLENRIDKIELEARYCSQYGKPYLDISDIKITIIRREGSVASQEAKTQELHLNLSAGYPDKRKTLAERCPELQDIGAKKLSEMFQ